jgi:hypothetical protein
VELVVRDAGTAAGNIAVADVRVESRRVVATVRNFGAAARDVQIRVEAAGRTLASQEMKVPPAASIDASFDAVPPTGPFDVAIDDPDGYAADNVRYGLAARRALSRVLIVAGGGGSAHGVYASRALQAGGEDGPDFDVRSVTGPVFAAMSAGDLRQQSVILLLSTHGVERQARESLRAFLDGGGGLFVAASPDVDTSVLSTVLDWTPALKAQERSTSSVLAATDLRHPIFRPFDAVAANLGQVAFQRLWQVDTGTDWRAIARYTDGAPALLERTAGQGRILLFTSDLDRRWNDFPVHTAFVPFIQESVRYLDARPSRPASLLVSDARAGTAAKPGIVEMDGRAVVLNVDPRESATERVSPAEFSRLVTRTTADAPAGSRAGQQTEGRQNYWQYGLLLMLGALIAESFVGAR